jgi:hypothetical protein
MQTKNRTTTVVTEAAAQASLRRGPTPALAPDEERVARMRLGAPPPRGARLERKALPASDAGLELLAFEIEAFQRWKAHLEAVRAQRPTPTPPPTLATPGARAKEKIVRALRKKS